MIYTVTLNPSLDRTLTVEHFDVGGTFKASHSDVLPAGKGINVARVIATLGEPVAALGVVGETDAPAFAAALAQAGIENRLTVFAGATRVSVTILDPLDHTETHLREPGVGPAPAVLARVRAELECVQAGDWVVLAGSLPPGVPPDTYRTLIRLCAARGARTMLDTSGPPLLATVGAPPTVLKPNLFELWQLDGERTAVAGEHEVQLALDEILNKARRVQARGVSMIVVTLGARGAIGIGADGRAWHARVSLDRPVVDAVGSGDALAAGWIVALARRAPLAEALRLGVACGAANAMVAGAGRCRKCDVERLAAQASVVEL
jgi:1-phosphofructokinase family hexose kinase